MSDVYIELYKIAKQDIDRLNERIDNLQTQIGEANDLAVENTMGGMKTDNMADIAMTYGIPGIILMNFITQFAQSLAKSVMGRFKSAKKP